MGQKKEILFVSLSCTYRDSGAHEGFNMYNLLRRSANGVNCFSSSLKKKLHLSFLKQLHNSWIVVNKIRTLFWLPVKFNYFPRFCVYPETISFISKLVQNVSDSNLFLSISSQNALT